MGTSSNRILIRGSADVSSQDPQIRVRRDVGWPDPADEWSSGRGKPLRSQKLKWVEWSVNFSKRG
jgi:hypothetical protein